MVNPRPPSSSEIKAIEEKQESFFNSKLLQIIGIVYTIGSPLMIWLVVSMFSLQSENRMRELEIKHLSEKMSIIQKFEDKFTIVSEDIKKIQIDLAGIKAEKGIK